MGNLESCDDHANSGRPVDLLKCLSYSLCNMHQMIQQLGSEVEPVVDLLPRHDERVSRGEGLYCQERNALIVLIDETAGQFLVDDLGEERRHIDSLIGHLVDPDGSLRFHGAEIPCISDRV